MFDLGILTLKTSEREKAVATAIRNAIQSGTFTYTELLGSKEPLRSLGLAYLDGTTVNQGRPVMSGNNVENWGGQPFRLIHLDPNGQIKVPVTEQVRILGTDQHLPKKAQKVLGNIADVPDLYPDRYARYVLVQYGWPARQEITGGATYGTVVEWKWLETEASKGASARPGAIELYETLKVRVDAWELAKIEAMTSPNKKTKGGAEPRV